ncbi:hypothetical protein N9Z92_01055, partial [Akkermansiaceae bacterium]|nr:hypothetical protein [Akkermansiaceae bacterium]
MKKICDPDSKMIPNVRLGHSDIYFRLPTIARACDNFVGPNRKLSDLAKFAVINIGKAEFKEV